MNPPSSFLLCLSVALLQSAFLAIWSWPRQYAQLFHHTRKQATYPSAVATIYKQVISACYKPFCTYQQHELTMAWYSCVALWKLSTMLAIKIICHIPEFWERSQWQSLSLHPIVPHNELLDVYLLRIYFTCFIFYLSLALSTMWF